MREGIEIGREAMRFSLSFHLGWRSNNFSIQLSGDLQSPNTHTHTHTSLCHTHTHIFHLSLFHLECTHAFFLTHSLTHSHACVFLYWFYLLHIKKKRQKQGQTKWKKEWRMCFLWDGYSASFSAMLCIVFLNVNYTN